MAFGVPPTGLGPRRAGPVVWCTLIVALAAILGCEVDRVPFKRLVEGKKFLSAGDPFKAADLFEDSIKREKDTASAARAHLAVAYDQAMRKASDIPSERAKYEQKAAAELARIADDPTAVAHLVSILEYHNLSSQSAEGLLVRLGPASVDALLNAFAMKSEQRAPILSVLDQIGAQSVAGVGRAIAGGRLAAEEQVELVRLLGSKPGSETEALLRQLRDDATRDPGVRIEAATALYRLGDKHDRDKLLAALDSDGTLARRAAAYAMTILNDPPDPSALIEHLDDQDAAVRLDLVRALGVHPTDPSVTSHLIAVLRHDADTDVATAAGKSLACYGPGVIDAVLDALSAEEKWPCRQRLVTVLAADQVRPRFTEQQEYRLYEHFEKREQNPDVKRDLAQLLKDLESK